MSSSTSEELVNPYCVTFELDDGNVYEEQFSILPDYGMLSKTVKQWCSDAGFTISMNGMVLTDSNTVELVSAAASCDGDFVLPDLQLHLQVQMGKPEQRQEAPRVASGSKNGTLAQIFVLVGALLVSGRYSLFPAASSPSNAETMFSVSLETIDHLREQLALQSAEIALLRSRSTPVPVPRVAAKPCPSMALQAEVAEKNATIIELRALLEKYGFTLERQYDEMYALRRRLRAAETCCSSVKQRDDRCSSISQTSLSSASLTTTGTMSAIKPYTWREPTRSVEISKATRTPPIAPTETADGSSRVLRRPLVVQDEPAHDRSLVAMADLTSRLQRLDNPLDSALRSSLLRIVEEQPVEKKLQECGPHLEGAAIHYAFVAEHGTWPKELKPKWNTTVLKCEAACRESPECGGWSFRWGQPHHLHYHKCFLYSSTVTSWFELRPKEERQEPEKYFVSGLCKKREFGSNASESEKAEAESVVVTNDTDDGNKALASHTSTGKSTAITALLGTLNQHRGITIFDSEFQIKAPASGVALSDNGKKEAEPDASSSDDDDASSASSSSSNPSSLALRAATDVMASPAAYQKRWKSASMWKFDDEGELPGRKPAKSTGFDRRGQYFDGSVTSAPVRPLPMRYLA
jgi:hypothetical protein